MTGDDAAVTGDEVTSNGGRVSTPVCILTIDVEDWFHLAGCGLDYQFRRPPAGPEAWDSMESRVRVNTEWVLDTLDRHGVKGTFFVMGWVAERHPELVREIHRRGHEVASHSYWHQILRLQTRDEFRADVRRSLAVLQDITGSRVLGFRAATASITDDAVDILAEEGLYYDSSLFPVLYHDVYGKLTGTDNEKPIERLRNGLWEVKLSCLGLGRAQLPWSGGGYFRLLPYAVFRQGVRRILASRGVFLYFGHPWELDAHAPRIPGLKPQFHFRRYVSIARTRGRFERLLSEFQFVPVREALGRVTGDERMVKRDGVTSD